MGSAVKDAQWLLRSSPMMLRIDEDDGRGDWPIESVGYLKVGRWCRNIQRGLKKGKK